MPEEIPTQLEETKTVTEVVSEIEKSPEVQVPVKSKPWLKPLLFSILGIVLAAGLVFAGYKIAQLKQVQPGPQPIPTPVVEATPTPDETANWKTYTNTKYNYQFRYPNELFEQDGRIYTKPPGPDILPTDILMTTVVEKKTDYKGPGVEDPVGTRKEVGDKIFKEIIQKLIIDGHSAVKIRRDVLPGSETDAVPGTNILIDLGPNLLSVGLTKTSEAELQKYNVTFDQILSTFRFIE